MMRKHPRSSRAGEPARSSTGAEVVVVGWVGEDAGGEGDSAGGVVGGEAAGLGDGEGEGGEEGEEGGLVVHFWWWWCGLFGKEELCGKRRLD